MSWRPVVLRELFMISCYSMIWNLILRFSSKGIFIYLVYWGFIDRPRGNRKGCWQTFWLAPACIHRKPSWRSAKLIVNVKVTHIKGICCHGLFCARGGRKSWNRACQVFFVTRANLYIFQQNCLNMLHVVCHLRWAFTLTCFIPFHLQNLQKVTFLFKLVEACRHHQACGGRGGGCPR